MRAMQELAYMLARMKLAPKRMLARSKTPHKASESLKKVTLAQNNPKQMKQTKQNQFFWICTSVQVLTRRTSRFPTSFRTQLQSYQIRSKAPRKASWK